MKLFAGTFLVAMLARLAQLGMATILARSFGPDGYGTFTFALGAAILTAQLASHGWPTLMSRYIPQYTNHESWTYLKGLIKAGDIFVFLATSIVALAIFLIAKSEFVSAGFSAGLVLASFLTVPMAFRLLRRQQLASIKKPAMGVTLDELVAPSVVVLSLLLVGYQSINQAFGIYIAASLIGVIVSTIILRRHFSGEFLTTHLEYKLRDWLYSARHMATVVACRVILNRIDVVMLAPLSTFSQVGLYGASFRVTFLIGMIPQIASMIMWPLISELYSSSRFVVLRKTILAYFFVVVATSAVLSFLVFVYSEEIIFLIFGSEFIDADYILKVLSISQFFAAFSSVWSSVLLMTGREGVISKIIFLGLLVAVVLNFWLVPTLGGEGAAIAMLVTNVVVTLFVIPFGWSVIAKIEVKNS